jgi:hypothetical protein
MRKREEEESHLIVEATPPLRIVSLCSVKDTILLRGYSNGELRSIELEGTGVKKKSRPAGDYMHRNLIKRWTDSGQRKKDYHRHIRKHTRQKV